VAGIVFYFVIPGSQDKAYFLNEREKFVAVERLRKNQGKLRNERQQG
jgi:hypothetical protein